MNVFILSTGRCGSTTFAKACAPVTNYTAAHESQRRRDYGKPRDRYRSLEYPDNHIEIDNRLSWFLGTLDERYGQEAFYVHLLRDREQVAASFLNRWEQRNTSIMFAFAWGILTHPFVEVERLPESRRLDIARQYWDTVNGNIRLFLRDKPNQMTIWLDDIQDSFESFWRRIGAQGDLDAALVEWKKTYNASPISSSVAISNVRDATPLTAITGVDRGPTALPGAHAGTQPGLEAIRTAARSLTRALQSAGTVDLGRIAPPVRVGRWTLSSETLRFLIRLVEELKPRQILEFGSGLSTRVLVWACARLDEESRLTSVDHDPEFIDLTRADLPAVPGGSTPRLVLAPIVARRFVGRTQPTYALPPEAREWGPADLVLIDGPPRALGGREGVLYQVMEFARPGTLVLLDDAGRAEERQALSRWQENLGDVIEVALLPGFPKGLAAITIREPIRAEELYEGCRVARRLRRLIQPRAQWIVVDDAILPVRGLANCNVLPFLEREGEYWGAPSNAKEAIRELDRLRDDGATHIAFLSGSFWWLDHYSEFATHLESTCRCVLRDEELIVFDLQRSTRGS